MILGGGSRNVGLVRFLSGAGSGRGGCLAHLGSQVVGDGADGGVVKHQGAGHLQAQLLAQKVGKLHRAQ